MIALTALVCAALFAGSALYISLSEHPARMRLDDLAAIVQALLALVGGVLGIAAWYRWQSNWFLLAGGVLLFTNIPFTVQATWRINGKLEALVLDRRSTEARALLPEWEKLHHVRTVLGLLATALIAYGLKP